MKSIVPWLLALAAMATLPGTPAAQTRAADLVGTTPELRIATLDGAVFDLAQQRGKWVVLNYWATWCAPCIKEIPELSELAEREDVEVLGLDFEEIERADLDAFLLDHPAGYAIAPVDVYDPPSAFPVPRGLPMTYLIAPDGKVAKAFVGPVTRRDIEMEIASAPAKPADGA
jgi:thiol-disulfide isomerase/thioredoxin